MRQRHETGAHYRVTKVRGNARVVGTVAHVPPAQQLRASPQVLTFVRQVAKITGNIQASLTGRVVHRVAGRRAMHGMIGFEQADSHQCGGCLAFLILVRNSAKNARDFIGKSQYYWRQLWSSFKATFNSITADYDGLRQVPAHSGNSPSCIAGSPVQLAGGQLLSYNVPLQARRHKEAAVLNAAAFRQIAANSGNLSGNTVASPFRQITADYGNRTALAGSWCFPANNGRLRQQDCPSRQLVLSGK